MGLPLFFTPAEPEEAAKSADKNSSRSRSTIRRQLTRRRPHNLPRADGRRYISSYDGSAPLILHDHVPGFAEIESFDEAQFSDLRTTVTGESVGTRRLRDIQRIRPPPEPSSSDFVIGTLNSSRSSRTHLHSSPDLHSNGSRASPSHGTPMPPVPESGDFQNNQGLAGHRSRRLREEQRRQRAESFRRDLNHTLARRETSTDLSMNGSGAQLPALTPNFSPARRYALEEPINRRRSDSPLSSIHHPYGSADREQTPTLTGLRSPPHDLRSLRDFPPLRRMGRRSLADFEAGRRRLRAARMDGLGDRDRSLSPDGDGAWETMLTTLTPDPQLPSAGSSFASASAVTSASPNTESSGTSLTSMGSTSNPAGAMNPGIDNFCDLPDDSQDSSDITDDTDDDSIYGNAARNRFWRAYDNVMATRDEAARQMRVVERDSLGGFQRIVRNLARREDIPDEWWAEAGLSRTLPRETLRL